MFNKDRVIEIAISCGAAACIMSSFVGFAVAFGILPYYLLPSALLGVAVGAIAMFVFGVLFGGK